MVSKTMSARVQVLPPLPNNSLVVQSGCGRCPVTAEIAGSNPVETAQGDLYEKIICSISISNMSSIV